MKFAAGVLAIFLAGGTVPHFSNVASSIGLTHTFPNGGERTKRYIIETTGSGAALFDYDADGFLDAFLISGQGASNRLYRNKRNGSFADITAEVGLTRTGWGQGVCSGDYNNDGFTDLFVTYWGDNVLYRNDSGKRFEDVAATAGLKNDGVRYGSGCAFLDFDRDGDLDLFVANYLKFDLQNALEPGANPFCWYRGLAVNCGPRGLPFDRNVLYRNDNGKFVDVSNSSGVSAPARHYSLGVLTGDFDDDGWTDIYVACDQTPSLLYINQRDGTFRDEALLRGTALDENGKALSGMGAAAGDYDGDGWIDIFRTNFSDERETLYRNAGKGNFEETTSVAGLARNTRFVGWGTGFFDFDSDGWKDLLLVNGHVFPEVDTLNLDVRYKDRPIVYRNLGNGKFDDISEKAGPGVLERHSSRGAAFGDIDNDGTVEILVNNQNETPSLLKVESSATNAWIMVKLIGSKSNRDGIGSKVRLTAGERTQTDEVRSGGSYLSQSDLRLHFGVGRATVVSWIDVRWPSGCVQTVRQVEVRRVIRIEEPPDCRVTPKSEGRKDTR